MRNPYGIAFYVADKPLGPSARSFVIAYTTLSLLTVTIAFCLHYMAEQSLVDPKQYSLLQERSYGEFIQYVLAYNASIGFLATAFLRSSYAYGLFAAIMAYLFLDDAFHIHESAGYVIAARLSLPSIWHLRPDDLGEVIFLSTIAAFMLGLLLAALRFTPPKQHSDLLFFTGLLILAGLFGIAVDAAHGGGTNASIGIIEDGGELIIVAALSVFSINRMMRNIASTFCAHTHTPSKSSL